MKDSQMILTFGKYKGHDVTSLPDEYLDWVIHEHAVTYEFLALQRKVRSELGRRRCLNIIVPQLQPMIDPHDALPQNISMPVS
jgi:hypothetical protein